ncbi:MAG: hypothetical protein IT436_05925 [Phycisphaerales bacterium]|nr:hypothetical protein [Phycisphaerales bacterium]
MRRATVLAGSVLLAAASQATAQPYEIRWYTIDGGGGTSSGGVYTLSGTAGQHDAGVLTAAPWVLEGGYWPGVVAPCPADLNGDGLVDFADYLEFLNLYDAGDLRVDFNGDGLVDFADYLEFLNLYDAGC